MSLFFLSFSTIISSHIMSNSTWQVTVLRLDCYYFTCYQYYNDVNTIISIIFLALIISILSIKTLSLWHLFLITCIWNPADSESDKVYSRYIPRILCDVYSERRYILPGIYQVYTLDIEILFSWIYVQCNAVNRNLNSSRARPSSGRVPGHG